MGVYDRQIAQAQKQIKKKGQLVTWTQTAAVVNDPSKPFITSDAGSPITYPVYIAFLSPRKGLSSVLAYLKNTDVVQAGIRGLMGAVDFVPQITDKVIRNGKTLTIRNIDPLAPNGQVILYSIEFNGN